MSYDHQKSEWDDAALLCKVATAKVTEAEKLSAVGVGFERADLDLLRTRLVQALANAHDERAVVRISNAIAALLRLDQQDRHAEKFGIPVGTEGQPHVTTTVAAMLASVSLTIGTTPEGSVSGAHHIGTENTVEPAAKEEPAAWPAKPGPLLVRSLSPDAGFGTAPSDPTV